MSMQLYNSISVEMKVDSIYYKVYMEGYEVAMATYSNAFLLPADSLYTLKVPFTVHYDKLFKLLEMFDNGQVDSVVYRVEAIVYSNYLLKRQITLGALRFLPLIKVPEFSIKEIKAEELRGSCTGFYVTSVIYSPNVFPFEAREMRYTFRMDGNDSIEGTVPGIFNFSGRDSIEMIIPVKMNLKSKTRKGEKFDISASLKLGPGPYTIDGSIMLLSTKGKNQEFRKK